MQPTRVRWVCGVIAICLVGACSEAGAGPTTTAEPPATTTTTSIPATTASPVTSTTAAVTTTVGDDQVGDAQALRAEIDEIRDFAVSEGESQFEGVAIPYPDINNPDPVVALKEAWAFEVWLMEIGPYAAFLETYNYPDSVRLSQIGSEFLGFGAQGVRFGDMVGNYEVTGATVVALNEAAMTDDARAGIPQGSVAVAYEDRGGPHQLIDQQTGEVLETIEAYEGSGVAVLSPSSLGWQLYWSGEATE